MNILCDYHHSELYESLLKVFERRLGCKVYRPIGLEWKEEGFWKIGDIHTANQHLGYGGIFSSGSLPGTFIRDGNGIGGPKYYSTVMDPYGQPPHNAITLEAAKEFKWDIVLATHPGHHRILNEFRERYCPSSKYIVQLGNVMGVVDPTIPNVLNSTGVDHSYIQNHLNYYQEFDTSSLEPQTPLNQCKAISSFLMFHSQHRQDAYWKLHETLPDWMFKEYGNTNKNGDIFNYFDQCARIREAAFLWHVKLHGDGYGYVLYRSLYAGKPVILNYSTVYRFHHRLAKLGVLQEGKTMVDFDGKTIPQLADAVELMRLDWQVHSDALVKKMRDLIDFNRECENIEKFLENLR